MPFIKVSGISQEKLYEIGDKLIDIINYDIEVPRERIKLFYVPMVEIREGKEVEDKTINVEVEWLPRPQELCDKLANLYREFFNSLGYKKVRIYIKEISKERNYDFK